MIPLHSHPLPRRRLRLNHLALAVGALLAGGSAFAQVATSGSAETVEPGQASIATGDSQARTLDKVTVVGSQIAGGGAEAALPVLTVGRDQLDATGATDGNELIRSLPQFGDIAFTQKTVNSGRNSNNARGDVGSINLRNIGAEYTLLLINGRRSVQHPISSSGAGRLSYNSNAIPTFGLERLDLLLDGAAAIYGSDAIAGVVNLVTQGNLEDGGGVKLEYGKAEGTERSDLSLEGYFGKDFAGGRGNVSVLYGLSHRSAQLNSDRWFTATDGRTTLADGSRIPDPNGAISNAMTPWGTFQRFNNGVAVGGTYYINAAGVLTAGTPPASLRYDTAAEPGITESPETDKANVFATVRFDLTDSLQLFGELGYYKAKSTSWLSGDWNNIGGTANYLHIRPDAYWVPEALKEGADAIRLTNYYIADSSLRKLTVDNSQSRALFGIRGWTDGGWNWESALLHSRAKTTDRQQGGLVSLFAEAVNRTDASAYNPFSGGNPDNPRVGDATPYDTADFIRFTTREGTTELALLDFKVNRPDLLRWYAGDIGFAAGVEYRYESRFDNRDPNIDYTVQYTDWYTGRVAESNFFTHSASPDIRGSRNVKSAFVELAVPLVAPEHDVPLVQSLDLQLAGRYEDYSDAGDVAKPKLALAWKVYDDLLLRGSASGGFRAPSLELVNSGTIWRFGANVDVVRCAALTAAGTYANYNACTTANPGGLVSPMVNAGTSYGDDVKPETTRQHSYGFVFAPSFIPERAGQFSIGADVWQIKVENPINTLGTAAELQYDAYLRIVEGTSNPNVVRADPSTADIAQFAGTGVAPAGSILYVNTRYANHQPLTAKGIDYNLSWRLRDTAWGNWAVLLNASRLKEYTQAKPLEIQAVANAIASGELRVIAQGLGAANEVGINGAKPEWRAAATLLWNRDDWTVRVRGNHIGSVVSGAYGDSTPFKVDSTQHWALSVKKDFNQGVFNRSSVEVGARNLFDQQAPLDASGNYLAALYESYGRYLYLNIATRW